MQRNTVLVLLAGCATSLSQRASMVRWTERPEDVAGCRFLGVVDGTSRQTGIANEGIGRNNARNEALEEAARRGATHVRWIGNDESFSAIRVTAETYDCRVQQPPSTVPAPTTELVPAPKPVAEASDPADRWWCIGLGVDNIGPCWDSAGLCEDQRVDFIGREPHFSPCAPQASAACFTLDYPTLGVMESCHTNAKACRLFYDTVAGEGRALTACRVLDKPDPGVRLFRRPESVSVAVSARPTPPAQQVPDRPTRDPADLRRWWCYLSRDGSWGDCAKTRDDCDHDRAELATRQFKEPCTLTDRQCIEAQANALGFDACAWQPRVSCFIVHYKLIDADKAMCSPKIKLCKDWRAETLKKDADDIAVKSECATQE